ncbi:hypothetical protein F5876DRAFT_70699 [Lentinula aff. lateritia]|uniref:Uncharacterized protein n=1 Tax=Lentinula aff. lateritia TaxID=2804960 RepID=A0ACC1TIM2_9AGAR|nr:hypothetical protein F5876DRAFT_70699 [Lentinula aff. lateritia]
MLQHKLLIPNPPLRPFLTQVLQLNPQKHRIINHADIILNGIEETDEAPAYVEHIVKCHTTKQRVTEKQYQKLMPFLHEYMENLFTLLTESHHNDNCMVECEGEHYLKVVRSNKREDIFNKNKEFEISQLILHLLVSLLEQFLPQPLDKYSPPLKSRAC